jgi:ribosomal protein S18 acetylase RimI-like enzyme
MYKFKRPESLSFPQVYYTFKARDKNSDDVIEYRVQDLPEEYYERAVDFMVKYFLPDETFCSSKGLPDKPSGVKEFRDFWSAAMTEKLSIGCFRNDGSDELVGANVLLVSSKEDCCDEQCLAIKDQDVADVMTVLGYASLQFDIYETYNVDQYLTAYGICVNPEYRGRGIATEMLKARAPILNAFGLKVTATAFTAIGSQIAAKKAGYKEVYVISYAEIEKTFPRFDFSKSVTKEFKTMVLKA